MSNQQFTLEYIVKLTGAGQTASGLNQVGKATQMNAAQTQKATQAQQQYTAAQSKGVQQTTQATRNFRALTFGLTGLTSSLVEKWIFKAYS